MRRPAQAVLPFEGQPDSSIQALDAEETDSPPTLVASSARTLGAYYTPPTATRFLTRWAVRGSHQRVLEPSMGDGAFLRALSLDDAERGRLTEVWGVEMATDTFAATLDEGLVDDRRAICSDFLSVEPFEVDCVVGNPPYVRLRHLPPKQAQRALAVAAEVLGEPMDPSGSIWMPFVLRACRFLVPGGRLALVLPYDLTYVRYARPLWRHLASTFGSLRVVRVHERMFPEILQEAVLLLADDFGRATDHVRFEAYETVAHLDAGHPSVTATIKIADLVSGDRAFLLSLLSDEARTLLATRIEAATVPAHEVVTFNIGYVCGDKKFFHPSQATIDEYGLTARNLVGSLTSARQLRGAGLRTSSLGEGRSSRLFLPQHTLTGGEQGYVRWGEELRVSERYKCRIRDPWYVTPYVKVPDVMLPVFTERPALLINDGRYVASNSLLCGYLRGVTAESLAAAWFTSLTLLQLELEVHALGGGVMVLVPREAGSVRVPVLSKADHAHLAAVHDLLIEEKVELAFSSGDEPVLKGVLGLSTRDVGVIQDAVDTLVHWRTASRTSGGGRSGEDVHEEQSALERVEHPVHEGGDVEVA